MFNINCYVIIYLVLTVLFNDNVNCSVLFNDNVNCSVLLQLVINSSDLLLTVLLNVNCFVDCELFCLM